tara:strand:+ start:330 stop:452 length:123 start_codon:yes stop_codon:yes gene_type:complete
VGWGGKQKRRRSERRGEERVSFVGMIGKVFVFPFLWKAGV